MIGRHWVPGNYLKPGIDCFPEGAYGFRHNASGDSCAVDVRVEGDQSKRSVQ